MVRESKERKKNKAFNVKERRLLRRRREAVLLQQSVAEREAVKCGSGAAVRPECKLQDLRDHLH